MGRMRDSIFLHICDRQRLSQGAATDQVWAFASLARECTSLIYLGVHEHPVANSGRTSLYQTQYEPLNSMQRRYILRSHEHAWQERSEFLEFFEVRFT